MPPQQGIRRDYGVEFEWGFAPYRLGLARQKSTLSVGESDWRSSQPFFEQLILSLKKLDDEQLMAMDQPDTITSRNDSGGGTEPMPTVYPDLDRIVGQHGFPTSTGRNRSLRYPGATPTASKNGLPSGKPLSVWLWGPAI